MTFSKSKVQRMPIYRKFCLGEVTSTGHILMVHQNQEEGYILLQIVMVCLHALSITVSIVVLLANVDAENM